METSSAALHSRRVYRKEHEQRPRSIGEEVEHPGLAYANEHVKRVRPISRVDHPAVDIGILLGHG